MDDRVTGVTLGGQVIFQSLTEPDHKQSTAMRRLDILVDQERKMIDWPIHRIFADCHTDIRHEFTAANGIGGVAA